MNEYLFVILIIIILIVLLYVEPLFNKYKIKNNNEYGSARFATNKEIKKLYKKWKINKIEQVGFPIIFSKNFKKVWWDNQTSHWVYLGSTGSGKSVTQVIPFCAFLCNAKEKRSAFITDPKGEIFSKTSKMFFDKGYNVLTIDFRNPEKSNKINILEPIIKEFDKYMEFKNKSIIENNNILKTNYNNIAMKSYAEVNRLIISLSSMIMKDKIEPKDPFWNNSAQLLLEGLIGFFLEEYELKNIKREQITMTSIKKFQNSLLIESNFDKFKLYLEDKKYGSKSKDSLISVLTASENTYKSITSVWGSKMALFDDINVANITSKCDFEFDILGKEKVVLYVIVPDEDNTYYTLLTTIIGLLYRELTKLANTNEDKVLPVKIDFILDEFANCPPLKEPSIESMISVARSRGMRFHFFIQSISQLDNVYGKEVSQIILDNCGLIYLKTNNQETAEAISKRLGKKTIQSNSISNSVNSNNNNQNKSISLMGRDLMTADEIKQLHYKMIIFSSIGYPIIRDTYLYNKFKIYKKGMIERTVNNLEDLSHTYFTIENINFNQKENIALLRKNKLTKNSKEMLEEKNKKQIELFKDIENILEEILTGKEYEINYKENNTLLYMEIKIDKNCNKELLKIKNKIDKDMFHINTKFNNGKIIIEVHFKSIFSLNKIYEIPKLDDFR